MCLDRFISRCLGSTQAATCRSDASATSTARGKILIETWSWLWSRLSFGWRLALRNIFRQRSRSSVTIFAAMMGAALTLTGFTLQYCLRYLVDFQFEKIMRSDVDLNFKDETTRIRA